MAPLFHLFYLLGHGHPIVKIQCLFEKPNRQSIAIAFHPLFLSTIAARTSLLMWLHSLLLATNRGLILVIIQGATSTDDAPKLSQTGNRLKRKMV